MESQILDEAIASLAGAKKLIEAPDPEGEAIGLMAQVSAAHAHLDVLVNSAGVAEPRGAIETTDVAGLQRLLGVNAVAPFFITKHALELMVDGGRIINVSSVAGFIASGTYAAAKSYVTTFSESLAGQLAGTGVTVTALLPGGIALVMPAEATEQAETTEPVDAADEQAAPQPSGRKRPARNPEQKIDVLAELGIDACIVDATGPGQVAQQAPAQVLVDGEALEGDAAGQDGLELVDRRVRVGG